MHWHGGLKKASDFDSDGIEDDWEMENALNPLINDSLQDADHDDAGNLKQYLSGTDPQNAPVLTRDNSKH